MGEGGNRWQLGQTNASKKTRHSSSA